MLPFAKYSGAGNDFVVVDARRLGVEPSRAARRMCPRRTGVGVDGLALVDPRPEGLGVRFFNPDGSEFGTCGNGSRCVALWAVHRGLAAPEGVDLETAEGPVRATIDGEEVRLAYRIEAGVAAEHCLPGPDGPRRCWLVAVGTPHLVMPVERLPEGPIEELCAPLRSHADLGPGGANVDLVEVADRGSARIRTFERGVEAETLACGAGCMAAALALSAAGLTAPELALETRSGERLRVAFSSTPTTGEGVVERAIELAGPARRVFEGRFPGLADEP